MKIGIVFRGEIERLRYDGYANACIHYTNWQKYIFQDLEANGYEFDIIFVTYFSDKLEKLKKEINPKEIVLCEKENSSQIKTLSIVNDYIQTHKNEYDRFIILRFDIFYKNKITQWNQWNSRGFILPNKDISWEETMFYNDILFIIDSNSLEHFNRAIDYMMTIEPIPDDLRINPNQMIKKHYHAMPHHIGQYFLIYNLPFEVMYEGLYEGTKNHPLYLFARFYDYNDSTYL
jgi:hypothetical protein